MRMLSFVLLLLLFVFVSKGEVVTQFSTWGGVDGVVRRGSDSPIMEVEFSIWVRPGNWSPTNDVGEKLLFQTSFTNDISGTVFSATPQSTPEFVAAVAMLTNGTVDALRDHYRTRNARGGWGGGGTAEREGQIFFGNRNDLRVDLQGSTIEELQLVFTQTTFSSNSVFVSFTVTLLGTAGSQPVSIKKAILLEWPSYRGVTYQVQKSIDLEEWQDVGLPIEGTGQTLHTFHESETRKHFYRLRRIP